jgi:hypothetical protein
MKLIDKDKVIAEIERVLNSYDPNEITSGRYALADLRDFINTLDVKDPYEECIQYDSIKAGIQAHAETYSFNIESLLFNQLTKDQQELWRKEIEQACISGGNAGVELARDIRYKENTEVKEADLEKEMSEYFVEHPDEFFSEKYKLFAKHFFELGLKAKKGE